MDTAIPEQGDLFAPVQLDLFPNEESPADQLGLPSPVHPAAVTVAVALAAPRPRQQISASESPERRRLAERG